MHVLLHLNDCLSNYNLRKNVLRCRMYYLQKKTVAYEASSRLAFVLAIAVARAIIFERMDIQLHYYCVILHKDSTGVIVIIRIKKYHGLILYDTQIVIFLLVRYYCLC